MLLIKLGIDCSNRDTNTPTSSVNKPILLSMLFILIPVIFGSLVMAIAKSSMVIKNRRGERRQPGHVPLERLKGSDIKSLVYGCNWVIIQNFNPIKQIITRTKTSKYFIDVLIQVFFSFHINSILEPCSEKPGLP